MKITPRVGAGSLRLGMSREEVAAAVGQPASIEDHSDGPEASIDWHYDEPDIAAYFDSDEDFRLTLVALDLPEAELLGHHPIGMSEADALAAYEDSLGLAPEDDDEELGISSCESEDGSITLWFQDGVCSSVQVSVYIDDDDELGWPAS